jgi:hypothetical protein
MIFGVTHDHDGCVVQRLSVSTKVSIGLPPNGDRNHPTKLDHFVFLRKKKTTNRFGWEVGRCPRSNMTRELHAEPPEASLIRRSALAQSSLVVNKVIHSGRHR